MCVVAAVMFVTQNLICWVETSYLGFLKSTRVVTQVVYTQMGNVVHNPHPRARGITLNHIKLQINVSKIKRISLTLTINQRPSFVNNNGGSQRG